MKSDIEIAQACTPKPIDEIADRAGVPRELLEHYGRYKAKVDYLALQERPAKGKLVLVTAINPTPAGEGKTTVSIGLADALNLEGQNVCLALREPSLGPVFGVKGGATGGGYAQVIPMEDINLHFTGDMHAITAANNLLAAMVDNSIQQGNPLGIDPSRVTWKRCMDMNDRQLRNILDGLGGKANGTPREDGFDITTASEIMATLCLASSIADLKARIARIVVARTYDDRPVTAGDIHAQGAVAALLRDALRPNLVQTLIGTPAFVHGGPFANIAHGCNTVIATKTALRLADVVVTEAGFGADLGAEKFIDIKCRMAGLTPSAVVLVATVRALKSHGGVAKADLGTENLEALERGLANLRRHLRNIREVWGLRPVVALNRFTSDTDAEIELVRRAAAETGAQVALCEVWAKGGEGGRELARLVLDEIAQAEQRNRRKREAERQAREYEERIAAREADRAPRPTERKYDPYSVTGEVPLVPDRADYTVERPIVPTTPVSMQPNAAQRPQRRASKPTVQPKPAAPAKPAEQKPVAPKPAEPKPAPARKFDLDDILREVRENNAQKNAQQKDVQQ